MQEYYKIKDHDDLVKSVSSRAVLNVNNNSLNKYREERERLNRLAQVVEDNERLGIEIKEIKNSVAEILELLRNKV